MCNIQNNKFETKQGIKLWFSGEVSCYLNPVVSTFGLPQSVTMLGFRLSRGKVTLTGGRS